MAIAGGKRDQTPEDPEEELAVARRTSEGTPVNSYNNYRNTSSRSCLGSRSYSSRTVPAAGKAGEAVWFHGCKASPEAVYSAEVVAAVEVLRTV